MNWWIWLWLITIACLTVGGAWDDIRDGRRLISTWLGVVAGALCILAVLAYANERLASALGKWLFPLCLYAGLQILAGAIQDVRALSPDPELSMRENRAIETGGIVFVGVIFGAAIVVGVRIGVQSW